MPGRRIEDLHPAVRRRCLKLIEAARQRGIDLRVIATLRSEAEQLALFAQGRKTLREVNALRSQAGLAPITEAENRRTVTSALTSVHQFGCAFDVMIVDGEGNPVWDTAADLNHSGLADYLEIGPLGESLGLGWGGRFSFRDYGHFEYTGGLGLAELKAGLRPEDKEEEEGGKEKMLSGKKTYLVGGAMLLYSIAGVLTGKQELATAAEIFMQGLGFIGLRLGIARG